MFGEAVELWFGSVLAALGPGSALRLSGMTVGWDVAAINSASGPFSKTLAIGGGKTQYVR